MKQDRLSNLSTIAIEKAFVKTKMNDQLFLNRVIDVFSTKKERRIDLIYTKI